MFGCCECCVLSGRGLCDELTSRLEESYRRQSVVICVLETSRMGRPYPTVGRSAPGKRMYSRRKSPENDENLVTLITNTVNSLMELLKDSFNRYYYTVFLDKSWYSLETTNEIKF
jgi:hypothetical protein